jgi:hypothetical protein
MNCGRMTVISEKMMTNIGEDYKQTLLITVAIQTGILRVQT